MELGFGAFHKHERAQRRLQTLKRRTAILVSCCGPLVSRTFTALSLYSYPSHPSHPSPYSSRWSDTKIRSPRPKLEQCDRRAAVRCVWSLCTTICIPKGCEFRASQFCGEPSLPPGTHFQNHHILDFIFYYKAFMRGVHPNWTLIRKNSLG